MRRVDDPCERESIRRFLQRRGAGPLWIKALLNGDEQALSNYEVEQRERREELEGLSGRALLLRKRIYVAEWEEWWEDEEYMTGPERASYLIDRAVSLAEIVPGDIMSP